VLNFGPDPRDLLRSKRKRLEPVAPKIWFVPHHFVKEDAYGNPRVFELDFFQRLFVTFDDAGASEVGKYANIVFLLAVVVATIFLVLSTVPTFKEEVTSCLIPACDNDPTLCPGRVICEPMPPDGFELIQKICAFIFCADYFTRVFLVWHVPARIANVLPADWEDDIPADMDEEFLEMKAMIPDPELNGWKKTWKYATQTMNLIDLGAIAPFLVEQFDFQIAFGTGFIRMLRLARVFRIFKIGKNNASINLLFMTLSKSLPALMLMGFFLALGVIIFGSTMYICESGEYQVTTDFPDGAFLRLDLYEDPEESPFSSIPIAFYWAVTTSTTVGYGDLFPTTLAGRLVCIISTFCAMIVLALPISVIGNNFNREYDTIKSGKYDIVVESITELLQQRSLDEKKLSEEETLYYNSRKCIAISAIADKMLNPIQQEKIKAALRLRGYEKALDDSRLLAKSKKGKAPERKVSDAETPVDMKDVPTPSSAFKFNPKITPDINPKKLARITKLAAELRDALNNMTAD